MNSTPADTPSPLPPYQECYTTMQPSAPPADSSVFSCGASPQPISDPHSPNKTPDEVDDCCTDCNCTACLEVCEFTCNVFLCCVVLFECCAALK